MSIHRIWREMNILQYISNTEKRRKLSIYLIIYLTFCLFPSPLNVFQYSKANALPAEKIYVKSELTEAKSINKLRGKLAHKASKILKIHNEKKTYGGLSKSQANAVLAIAEHFPEKDFSMAIKIAWCESRLNPSALNGSNTNGTADRGLFQLNDGGTMQRLGVTSRMAFDPYHNARAAKILYDDRGWKPWVCHNKL
jgi:hypothetical protein